MNSLNPIKPGIEGQSVIKKPRRSPPPRTEIAPANPPQASPPLRHRNIKVTPRKESILEIVGPVVTKVPGKSKGLKPDPQKPAVAPAKVKEIVGNPQDSQEQEFLKQLALPGGTEDLVLVSHYAAYLSDQKREEEAEKYFQLAFAHKDSQKDIFTLSRYALFLNHLGKLTEARAVCKKALFLPGGQEDFMTFSCYAAILRNQKDYQKSLSFFRKALAFLESRRTPAIFNQHIATVQEYVEVLRSEEKYEEAENVLKKALEEPSRHDPRLFRMYGQILHWQEKFSESKQQYAKALELEKS